jgi:hypothetical protein
VLDPIRAVDRARLVTRLGALASTRGDVLDRMAELFAP